MKLSYDRETDSLYIELAPRASADLREVADGIVLDFDAHGRLVAIDIDYASTVVDLSRLNVVALPVQAAEFTAA